MRRSRFTQNEILQLLGEASAGVPVAEICGAAGITPRTFYRWRRQFGGLHVPAVRQMKPLVSENIRLRGLVTNLFERLRRPDDDAPEERRTLKATAPRTADERARPQNLRLIGLVSNLVGRLRTFHDDAPEERRTLKATAPRTADERARDQMRASRIAAEKCGGALTGHFASVRVNR